MESIIEEYLDEVCSYIRFKEVHLEIKEEIRCHIEEFVEEFVDRGMGKEEALKKAIKAMGGSDIVGERLNKVHKDKIDWISLIIISFLSMLGVVLSYFISMSHKTMDQPVDHAMDHMRLNITYICLGGIILGLLYLWDIRKLKKYSFYIFFSAIALFGYGVKFASIINGKMLLLGRISLEYPLIILFFISSSGILELVDWEKTKNILYGFLITIVPVLVLAFCKSLYIAFIYLTIIIVLICKSKMSKKQKIIISFGVLIPIFIVLINNDEFVSRIAKEIDYMNNQRDYGFIRYSIHNILKDVKMFGSGFVVKGIDLPLIDSSFIMVYLIIALGWVGFGIVLFCMGIFFLRVMRKISSYNNSYLKNIAVVFTLFLFIEALIHILVSINVMPLSFYGYMPFLSYGITNILTSFIAFGLILSSYRRRNLKLESKKKILVYLKISYLI